MKRVLITGAHGFLGRYVAKIYGQAGFYVIGLGHGSWSVSEAQVWGINEWHHADVDMDVLQSYAADVSTIVHCAGSGSVGFSLSNPMKDLNGRFGRRIMCWNTFARSLRRHD